MKNLTHYFESAEDLYDNTVARKEEIGLRQRLENLSAAVYERYRIYEDAFDNSNLESIAIDPAFEHHSNDLGALYGYNFSTIKEFRKSLEDLQPLTIRYTCQYCTLSRHDSIDHYLPQSSFPEYSIYTRNLVLCCTSCNRIKWRSWLTNGRREFINFYLDQLPAVQYLFAEVLREANGEFNFRYYLANVHGIDPGLFALLENHYRKLRLFDHMRKSSSEQVSEFMTLIESYTNLVSQDDAIQTITESIEKNRVAYGMNHYLEIAKLALIQDPVFMNQFRWRL